MPRIYLQEPGSVEPNDPMDFCQICWPIIPEDAEELGVSEEALISSIKDAGVNGHDHPSYDDGCEVYECMLCHDRLRVYDN